MGMGVPVWAVETKGQGDSGSPNVEISMDGEINGTVPPALPNDLWRDILGLLNWQGLSRAMRLNTTVYSLGTTPQAWEPHLESLTTDQLTQLDAAHPALRQVTTRERSYRMTAYAGGGTEIATTESQPSTAVRLFNGRGLGLDQAGNLYITDVSLQKVLRVNAIDETIDVIAGTGREHYKGDGRLATKTKFQHPWGVAVDQTGNVYIADYGSHKVLKVNAIDGILTTIAGTGESGYNGDGQPATEARLDEPRGVAVDKAGNVYIVESENARIRKVNAADGRISTYAGGGNEPIDGTGQLANTVSLQFPWGMALDDTGNLYITEFERHQVLKIDGDGVLTIVAGTGRHDYSGDGQRATAATLNFPRGLAVDPGGNLYIADSENNRIRKVNAADGIISTVAGSGPTGSTASATSTPIGLDAMNTQLVKPQGVAVDKDGYVYFTEYSDERVRRFRPRPNR